MAVDMDGRHQETFRHRPISVAAGRCHQFRNDVIPPLTDRLTVAMTCIRDLDIDFSKNQAMIDICDHSISHFAGSGCLQLLVLMM